MCTNEAVLTSCSLCTANHRRWRLATRTEQTVATIQCSTRRQLMWNNTHKSTDARADRIEWAQKWQWSRDETQGRRGTPKMQLLTWISLWLTQLCASFFAMSAMYPQLSLRCSAARVLMRFWLWTIRILRLSLWVLWSECVELRWWWEANEHYYKIQCSSSSTLTSNTQQLYHAQPQQCCSKKCNTHNGTYSQWHSQRL